VENVHSFFLRAGVKFGNAVLRGRCGLNVGEVAKQGENYVMRSIIIYSCSTPNIRVTKQRKIKWAAHVACVGI
jgi:hypothetical protein